MTFTPFCNWLTGASNVFTLPAYALLPSLTLSVISLFSLASLCRWGFFINFFVLVSNITSHSSRQQLDQYSHMHVCAERFAVCRIFVDTCSLSTAYSPRLVNILLTTRDMMDFASITFIDAYLPSKACEQFAANQRQWLVMVSLSLMPIYHQLTAVQGWWIVWCQPQRQQLVNALLLMPTHRQLFTIQSWQTVCRQQLVTASIWLKHIHRQPCTIQKEWLMLLLFWRIPYTINWLPTNTGE